MKIFSVLVLIIFMLTSSKVFAAETRAGLEEFSESVNIFNWNYFKNLDKNKNIFYSPYSIAAAFSIVANGAKGTTQKEILAALDAKNIQMLNDGFKNFREVMENEYTGGRILNESNLILIDKKFIGKGINPKFKDVVENIYGSEVDTANFEGNLGGEKRRIKNFVAEKTNNFISNYKSLVTESTVLDLLNVIYFKGDWENPFKATDTWKSDFFNRDGSKSKVQMMSQSFQNEIRYYADEKYMGIEMPYKKLEDGGEVVAMYVILPRTEKNPGRSNNEKNSYNENDLSIAESWNAEEISYRENFLRNLQNAPIFQDTVAVFIPKFELDIKNDLNEDLKKMGIRRAFTNSAEFSNIIKNTQLKISNATHQAKIKVDEKGTEAAAVTEIEMLATAIPGVPKIIYFCADRPFLFVIRDVPSGINLFTGVINLL